MSQQRGFKRAQKVLKRKQRLATVERKTNIKKAIYAFKKLAGAHAGHSHEGHSHEGHEGHDHG